MQPDFSTPMMKQYTEIKKQYPDCLLFYRMGDFYELFMEDAHTGARVLNITLTGKSNGKNGRIPMAGVPYHAVDAYLTKLVKAGYKVAICEQLSPPNKKGLVKRDVVRIVTPGTIMDEKALDKKRNNYIISLSVSENAVAFAIADISTGYFALNYVQTKDISQTIQDELAKIHPAECILAEKHYNNSEILSMLRREKDLNIFPYALWDVYADESKKVLQDHFGVGTLAGFGITDQPLALETAAALLGYLQETQKQSVRHIKKILTTSADATLLLDRSTVLNLELFSTIRAHESRGTLLSVLDETVTPMGGRLLKEWLKKPLIDRVAIHDRHETVAYFAQEEAQRAVLREKLTEVSDIERLISRLSVGLGNGRDVINLKNSLQVIVEVKGLLGEGETTLLKELGEGIHTCHPALDAGSIDKKKNDTLERIISYIEKHILPEPPITLREGKIIQTGINKELDQLRKIVGGSRDLVLALEQQEREKTGIASLKVRFNQVFGFYIEVSKANAALVPGHYIRKQTLVNGERFITPELKEQEEIILSSEERINELEYQLFQEALENILSQVSLMQEAAQSIATLDCLLTFAQISKQRNYIRPQLLTTGEIQIAKGRHPVVERLLEDTPFVPNDVTLDNTNQQLLLITGPNMAGKSVFIRQVALIVLMSQIGCFVPASKAQLSIVDKIFVRSGASDVITSGLSTFMVEMVETANILHHATEKSLIIMDEIGRGTSTYDGISIAWAVAEYLVSQYKIAPKTLFATHYHELQVLEERYPKHIRNFHAEVTQEKGEPVFLHTMLPGGASHSFGVAVAKLAGLPEEVITRAKELLEELESNRNVSSSWLVQDQSDKRKTDSGVANAPQNDEVRLRGDDNLAFHLIHKELEAIDIHQLTPLEALNKLAELKDKLKLFTAKQKEFLEID
ncbi:MAG: DNA mismatch repair protein MutS [Patescibacteria group bacterium]